MLQTVYTSLTTLAAPAIRGWLSVSRGHRELTGRFQPPSVAIPAHAVWIHACSVGEIRTATPLLKALRATHPDFAFLITVSTRSGWELAHATFTDVPIAWFPFDVPAVVRRFVAQVRPRCLILIETEIWPNLLRELSRRGIPAMLVNGRLSDKHMPRYRLLRNLFSPAFSSLALAAMQSEEYAQRAIALGARSDQTTVMGNIKFDGAVGEVSEATRTALRDACGLTGDVLIVGSTRPGDEALIARLWKGLSRDYPTLRLVIAIRHAARLSEALACFDEPVMLRSAIVAGKSVAGARILFVDTLGELTNFYACAQIAIVGGSFFPGVNGHNPIEPAALGVPTIFGPYMRNFADAADALVRGGGSIQVPDSTALDAAIRALLDDASRRQTLGMRGQTIVRAEQGAVSRAVASIDAVLENCTISNGN